MPGVPLTSYQAGTALTNLADMNALVFKGTVDEIDVGKLHEGMPAHIKIGALPEAKVEGKIYKISPKSKTAEGATLFDVEIELLPAKDVVLRAGYSANAEIAVREKRDVLLVPERLVTFADGKASVELPGKAEKDPPVKKEIKTGLSDGMNVEVAEGLGERTSSSSVHPRRSSSGLRHPGTARSTLELPLLPATDAAGRPPPEGADAPDPLRHHLGHGVGGSARGLRRGPATASPEEPEGARGEHRDRLARAHLHALGGTRQGSSDPGFRGRPGDPPARDSGGPLLRRVRARPSTFRRERARLTPDMSATNPVFAAMRNLIPASGGRYVNDIDVDRRRRVVFLGDKLKQDLFGEADAVGRTVMIDNIPFLVVGVMEKKAQDSSYSGRDQDKAFIPDATFKGLFSERNVSNFIFQAASPSLVPAVTKRVYEVLGRRLKFDPKDKEAIGMWDTTEGEKIASPSSSSRSGPSWA